MCFGSWIKHTLKQEIKTRSNFNFNNLDIQWYHLHTCNTLYNLHSSVTTQLLWEQEVMGMIIVLLKMYKMVPISSVPWDMTIKGTKSHDEINYFHVWLISTLIPQTVITYTQFWWKQGKHFVNFQWKCCDLTGC